MEAFILSLMPIAIQDYLRWGSETYSDCLKGRGFNMKKRLTDPRLF